MVAVSILSCHSPPPQLYTTWPRGRGDCSEQGRNIQSTSELNLAFSGCLCGGVLPQLQGHNSSVEYFASRPCCLDMTAQVGCDPGSCKGISKNIPYKIFFSIHASRHSLGQMVTHENLEATLNKAICDLCVCAAVVESAAVKRSSHQRSHSKTRCKEAAAIW